MTEAGRNTCLKSFEYAFVVYEISAETKIMKSHYYTSCFNKIFIFVKVKKGHT